MINKSAQTSGYRKDFVGWAKLAEQIEHRTRPANLKSGLICWCYLGVNIGTEQDGRGENFARPVLILDIMSRKQALVLPFTSKRKHGKSYLELFIKGRPETLIVNKPQTIDTKRIDIFLDEISDRQLREIRRLVANRILNPPQIKWQDSE